MAIANFTDDSLTLDVLNPKFAALVQHAVTARVSVPAFRTSRRPSSVSSPPLETPRPSVERVPKQAVRRPPSMPPDAKPERALRFVAHKLEVRSDRVLAILHDNSRRELAFRDCASLYARRLPPDPPWDSAFVMDLAPRSGEPIRVLASTFMNVAALPGAGAPSHVGNSRKLAAYIEQQNPDLMMDPETRTFVSGFGPCVALAGIEQFFRYDARYET